MSVGTEIWLFSLSVIASALGGTLGMASGIFIVPILTMLCHVDLRNAIGASSAILGIGSGVLKVPAMDTALRLPIKVSSATSNFMICVTAAASAGAYFMRGEIVAAITGPVALGSVVGAILGARLLVSIPSQRIRLLFATVLIAVAAQMFFAGFGKR